MKAGVARVIGRDSRAFTQSPPPGERATQSRVFPSKDTASSVRKGPRAWVEEVVVVLRMGKKNS